MRSITIVLSLIIAVNASAQINRNYSLGYLATVFTGIYPTDSCLYIKGVMTDSLYRSGSFFLKTDLNGEVLHLTELVADQKVIESWGNSIAITPEGNFIILGYLLQLEEPTSAIFLQEVSPAGELLRELLIPSPYYPQDTWVSPMGIVTCKNGGYILSGILGNVNNYKGVYFVSKVDTAFNLSSINAYKGPKSEAAFCIQEDEQGNWVVGGLEFTASMVYERAMRKRITLIDPNSKDVQWDWVYPPDLPIIRGGPVLDMILQSDGSIIGASAIAKTLDYGYDEFLYHPSIFKLNADRSLAWERAIGGGGRYGVDESMMQNVFPANDGGGYVGAAAINFLDTQFVGGYSLGMISKVSEQGDSLWTRYFYRPFEYRRHKVYDMHPAVDKSGYFLAGMTVVTPIDTGGYLQQQGWLVRVDNYGCLSPGCHLQVYSPEAAAEDNIHLYPNPASNYLVIDHGGHDFSQGLFRIHDAQGRVQAEWRAPQGELSTLIPVAHYPAGQYWLWYEGPGGVRVRKGVVKQ